MSTEPEEKMEIGAEEKTSAPPPPAEEKTSDEYAEIEHKTEEKTSAKPKRLRRYDGSGRRTNDEEMDEILDAFLLYGILPQDVSERQRRDYKKHPRIPLRRLHLEQAGLLKKGRTGKTRTTSATRKDTSTSNVLDLAEQKARRRTHAN